MKYTHLAQVIIKQIGALQTIWTNCLQFKNMTLTITILNVRNSMLYSREKDPRGALYGYPVQTDSLQYSFIVDRDSQFDYLIDIILKRFVNYFGLLLHKILDVNGKLVHPEKLKYNNWFEYRRENAGAFPASQLPVRRTKSNLQFGNRKNQFERYHCPAIRR